MRVQWSKYKLVIFDLDNTLYRETDYLFAAYERIGNHLAGGNYARAMEYSHFLCRSFVEEGRKELFQRLIAKYELVTPIDELLSILWQTECSLELYPQMKQCIASLLAQQIEVAVLTNGQVVQQKQKVANLRLQELFPEIQVLYAAEIAAKPSPLAVEQLVHEKGVTKKQTVLIGDSEVDKQTALNAGIEYIDVCYLIK